MKTGKCVVIGCSAGGIDALSKILCPLSAKFPYPIVIVQHLALGGEEILIDVLDQKVALTVQEAISNEKIKAGHVYIAPGDYHLLLEQDETFNISIDHRIYGSRPSIDILFETAVDVYREKIIAILLTGNNQDGAFGCLKAHEAGAEVLIQDPREAVYPRMPQAAIDLTACKKPYKLSEISARLQVLDKYS